MSDPTSNILLRLPKSLHEDLREIAANQNRSMNRQLVHVLEQFVRHHKAKSEKS